MAEKVQKVKDVHLIQNKLDDVNKLISPYKLAYVSPTEDCVPLQKNAHYMQKETLSTGSLQTFLKTAFYHNFPLV